MKNQKINYAELYGVNSDESDFIGAINRNLEKIKENGIPHLDNFIKLLKN